MAHRSKIRHFLGRCVLFAARHRNLVRSAVVLSFLLSLVLVVYGGFSNDISRMLPDGSRSAKSYAEINRSGMFNKLVLVLNAGNGKTFSNTELAAIFQKLIPELKKIPSVKHVDYQYLTNDFAASVNELSLYIPQLFSPEKLPSDDLRVEKAVRSVWRRMMLPSSIGQTDFMRADPFGLNTGLYQKLQEFQSITGMRISPKSPYLVAENEKHAMLLLETDVPVSDAANARKLLDSVSACLEKLPDGVTCDMIGAHRRAVCNETVLRGDVKLVCWMSTLIFALLFIVFYRCDVRSFLIPVIPLFASAVVLGVMTLLFDKVLFFVVGMGGIVISLAVDYGIHTYAVMTGKGRFFRLIHVVPALCAGALTSIAAFVLFSFSGTEGVRQLGFFSGASLLLSLLLMLFLLPSFLAKGKQHDIRFRAPSIVQRHPRVLLAVWTVLMLAALAALTQLRFNSDIRQFDVSPKSFDREEAEYAEKFMSGTRPAMLLFQGPEKEQVLKNAENTLSVLRAKTSGSFFAPTDVYPSEKVRMRNLELWRAYLRNGEFAELKRKMNRAAEKYEFKKDFFDPFFESVEKGVANPPSGVPHLFAPLLKRFSVQNGPFYTLAVLFPDDPKLLPNVVSLTSDTIISQNGLAAIMSDDVTRGMTLLGLTALLLVIVITRCFFKTFFETFLALIPVATSLAAVGAVFAVCGVGLNLSILIGAIILAGLSVDYGIFMVHSQVNGKTDDGIFNAVTLSAVTSAAGGATVIFTTHPMLRDAGLTLIIGISTAWLTGILIVPALKNLMEKRKLATLLLPILPAVFLCASCATDPFEYEPLAGKPEIGELTYQSPPRATVESSVVGEYRFQKMSLLSLTQIDFVSGFIRVAGLSPAGMKIFDISGTKDRLESYDWIPGKYWNGHEKEASRMILGDISAIYLDNLPVAIEKQETSDDGARLTVFSKNVKYVFAGAPPRLIEKTLFENGKRIVRIKYYRYSGALPANIMLENFKYDYRLVIRTISVEGHEK